jgi:hypothetical protein
MGVYSGLTRVETDGAYLCPPQYWLQALGATILAMASGLGPSAASAGDGASSQSEA